MRTGSANDEVNRLPEVRFYWKWRWQGCELSGLSATHLKRMTFFDLVSIRYCSFEREMEMRNSLNEVQNCFYDYVPFIAISFIFQMKSLKS